MFAVLLCCSLIGRLAIIGSVGCELANLTVDLVEQGLHL